MASANKCRMVRRIGGRLLFVSLGLALISCSKERPIIAIDHKWNVDYAKEACRLRNDSDNPCVGDPIDDVSEFESHLVTSFASQSACSNVEVVSPNGKTGLEAYWLLMIDYTPGKPSQNWKIVHSADFRTRQDEGDPDRIALTACAAVKGTGASIRE